jgi:hypothetical protein
MLVVNSQTAHLLRLQRTQAFPKKKILKTPKGISIRKPSASFIIVVREVGFEPLTQWRLHPHNPSFSLFVCVSL